MTAKAFLLVAAALGVLIAAAYVLHHPGAAQSIARALGH
jgi:hypothetical protein